jgi:hypothetical protein
MDGWENFILRILPPTTFMDNMIIATKFSGEDIEFIKFLFLTKIGWLIIISSLIVIFLFCSVIILWTVTRGFKDDLI